MNNLNAATFLVPVIALILVGLLFIYLLKKVDNKAAFKLFSITVLILAFLLNFVWEVIQVPLYKDASYTIQHIAFCALASLADAIMVLLIYFGFAFIYRDPLWIQRLQTKRVIAVMLVGTIGAVLAEMRHTAAGNWTYDESMPVIPVVNVGLSPVLQFMLLPVVIYYAAFYLLNKNRLKNYSNDLK